MTLLKRSLLFASIVLGLIGPWAGEYAFAASKAQEAFKLYQSKDYAKAAQVFEEHLALNPKDGAASYYAALCYQQRGNMPRAISLYRRVVELMPDSQLAKYSATVLQKVDPKFQAGAQAAPDQNTGTASKAVKSKTGNLIGPDQGTVYFRSEKSTMWVSVDIDGRHVEMAVDTGAPGITIGADQLRAAGGQAPTGKFDGETYGSANDSTISYHNLKANLRVGPYTLSNSSVKVLEQNYADPLLGQGFLQYFDYTIDQSAKCIRLRRKDAASPQHVGGASGYSVPFTFRAAGKRIIVDIDINGRKSPVMVDTGNVAAVLSFGSPEQAKKYGAPVPQDADISRHTGISGSGANYVYHVNRIRLGPIEKLDAKVSANVGTDDSEVPLLGQEFFDGWQYTIDMANRKIHLLRR